MKNVLMTTDIKMKIPNIDLVNTDSMINPIKFGQMFSNKKEYHLISSLAT
jgi:hypothetical protein